MAQSSLKAAKANLVNKQNLVIEAKEKLRIAESMLIEAEQECMAAEIKEVGNKEIFWRFPHLGEQILQNLCNESLTKCRRVNRNWRHFVDEQKILYIRKIEAYTYISNESTRKTLHKQCLSFLKEIADEAQESQGPLRR